MRAQGPLLALVVLTAGACGDQPDPAYRLKTLRVLGVQHEPVWPAPGDVSRLTPIVYTPAGTSAPTYAWSWCPMVGAATDGYPCMVTADDLTAQGLTGVPASDLGTGATADFPYSMPQEPLAQFCAQTLPGTEKSPDCRFGMGVGVRMTIATASPVADSIDVVDTLRLQVAPATAPNANPTLGALTAVVGGVEVPLDDLGTVTIPRDVFTTIKVAVPATSAEEYPNPRLPICSTAEPTLHESLSLDWFVECGDLDKDKSGYRESINTFEEAGTNKWKPGLLKDCPTDTARIVVTIRDVREVLPSQINLDDKCQVQTGNRLTGGIGWTSAMVSLEAAK